MPTNDEFMNVFDAAALLGVHVQTLRNLARQRRIPAFKVGRDWRFRKEALIRWSDEQHRTGTGSDPCSALVIDHEERTCAALVEALEGLGCRARQASSGRRGLELISQEAPDLILLDLAVSDMSGVQFLGELRQTQPELPVIIVTGHPGAELMKQAAHFAPVMLLPKPVRHELLERTVRAVVGERLSSGTTASGATALPREVAGRNP